MWFGAGYANILHQGIENVTPCGAAGGIFGIGYGLEHKHFILQTGVEFDYKLSVSKFDDFALQVGRIIDLNNNGAEIPIGTTITASMYADIIGGFYDTEGEQFAMLYKFSKYKDLYSIGYVNFPLLFGGKFGSFYFMLGGKFGINLLATAKTTARHSAIAAYPQFMDAFGNMGEHFLLNDANSSDNTNFSFKLGFNVAASAEIGYTFPLHEKKSGSQLRIALFADYGVLNINPADNLSKENTPGDFVYVPATEQTNIDPNIIRHNSLLTSFQSYKKFEGEYSDNNQKYSVNPLLVGVKFTLQFSTKPKTPCPAVQKRNHPVTERWEQGAKYKHWTYFQ
ncbi:hypothetical protein FACS1894178_0870 [Bacteroidia bacterium]|nr:hypothetical protein FACS1894178_0870 [Bacteroidia bacterium]